MKIAVVGSREFKDENLVYHIMHDYFDKEYILISGGARGVDSWAENYYKTNYKHPKCNIFKPEWDKYGKSAGFIRNKLIIDEADMVLAFWSNQSRGTKHSIDLAIKAGKPINIYIR